MDKYGWDSSTGTLNGYTPYLGPLYLNLSGFWYGALDYVGDRGYFWSQVANGSLSASDYALISGFVLPRSALDRIGGLSVRCVSR